MLCLLSTGHVLGKLRLAALERFWPALQMLLGRVGNPKRLILLAGIIVYVEVLECWHRLLLLNECLLVRLRREVLNPLRLIAIV